MGKRNLVLPKPVPSEQLPLYTRCLHYIRRVGGREVEWLDAAVWKGILQTGFSSTKQGALPDFVLLDSAILGDVWFGYRALVTLQVRRTLPPYVLIQRYVIGSTVAAVQAKTPKREAKARPKEKEKQSGVRRRIFLEEDGET